MKDFAPPTLARSVPAGRLPLPEAVDRKRVNWPYLGTVVTIHLLALLAFMPALFQWTSLLATFCSVFLFGTFGINICYHRLLAHRSFRCSRRFEHFLAVLGICCLQESPVYWVAAHRLHHRHSDEQPDPHSPLAGFFWSHIGWLWLENRDLIRIEMLERYVRDLLRDRFYLQLAKPAVWLSINLAQWMIYFLLGAAWGWFATGRPGDAVLAGVSMLVWGVFVRTVLVWHITWSVNSVTHLWGYRSYATNESSRNNWLVGLFAAGEGWHNNHHAQPHSAAHGHCWWEIDLSYLAIRAMERLGLVWDVVRPDLKACEPNSSSSA